jgi:hypothetical protein
MEAKWPFMVITFVLLFLLGLTIANLERTAVMSNWSSRRCELPILAAASFFKPEDDPRTKSEFSTANFEFCMKSYVDKFTEFFMGPINSLFSANLATANGATESINGIRNVAQTMYNAFASYIASFFEKFNSSVFEISRIVQYMRMGMNRMSAMAMSMIYSGLTVFRGILNSIQFVIRVVLIICTIMLIIIIILFFILFPIMPIIMGTLVAIVSIVMALSVQLSSALGEEAASDKRGFCFSEGTMIFVKQKDGTIKKKEVKDITLGDELAYECGAITATILMDGTGIPLSNLNEIYVSDSHLVKGTDTIWKSVSIDERAVKTDRTSKILYCFNTTTNTIPVAAKDDAMILFRDWEEIDNEDEEGQFQWNQLIATMLNVSEVKKQCNDPLVGINVLVKTSRGFIPISTIKLRDDRVLDKDGNPQCVKGVIYGEVEDAKDTCGLWISDLYEYANNSWRNVKGNVPNGKDTIVGMSLMTESGTFIIWDEVGQKERCVRDFTEVGYHSIHETYSFVEARLRITEPVVRLSNE